MYKFSSWQKITYFQTSNADSIYRYIFYKGKNICDEVLLVDNVYLISAFWSSEQKVWKFISAVRYVRYTLVLFSVIFLVRNRE